MFEFGCLELVFSRRVKYLVSIIINSRNIEFIIAMFYLSLEKHNVSITTIPLSVFHRKISSTHRRLLVVDNFEMFFQVIPTSELFGAKWAREPRQLTAPKVQVTLKVLSHRISFTTSRTDVWWMWVQPYSLGQNPAWKIFVQVLRIQHYSNLNY